MTTIRPGVYTQEQLTPLQVSTNNIPGQSVACFAASYNQGPVVPTLVTSWQNFVQVYGNFGSSGINALHYAVWTFFNNGGTQAYILRVPNANAVNATLQLMDINGTPRDLAILTAVNTGVAGNNIYVSIAPVVTGSSQNVNLTVYVGGTSSTNIVENWSNVSANPASARYIGSILNAPPYAGGSSYVNIGTWTYGGSSTGSYVSGTTDFATISGVALGGTTSGSDGTTGGSSILGGQVETLLDQYCQQQLLMLNLPYDVYTNGPPGNATMNSVVSWAAGREDVFVFMDGPIPNFPETSGQVVTAYTGLIAGTPPISTSSYVAIHAPYLEIQDPSSAYPGATRWVAPSGSVMGSYCYADSAVGPQQAGAGITYGQMNAQGLEVQFSPTDLNTLANAQVNAIKVVPGSGICNFGVRTQLMGYPDQFIPVRRVLEKVEHDATILTMFALFMPNDEQLWENIVTVLNQYLTQQTLSGLFSSVDVTQAFNVICDSTNNTPASAQAGYLNITIAVALGSPAEIITITIQQLAGSAQTTTTNVQQ